MSPTPLRNLGLELLRTPFGRSSNQGYAFVSSRRPAPSSFSRTLNSKATTFLRLRNAARRSTYR